MFEENQSENLNRPVPPEFQPGRQEGSQEPKKEGPMDIHTMPRKFMKEEKSGKGQKKLLIIILLIVIFAGVAAGAVFLFNRLNTPENSNSVVINTNLNENANANLNANLNENLNLNTNVNTNLNSNTNVNENTNINSNTNTNLNTNMALNTNTSISLTPPLSTTDSDEDGLTDVEEALWGTNPNQPDTDGDGYEDLPEIKAGYDPTAANTELESTSLVGRYNNTDYNWSMLYPAKWSPNQLSSATGEKEIMFSPDSGTLEYIQVSFQENPTRLSAMNWYLSINPGVDTSQIEEITVNGLEGIRTPDQTSIYLSRQDKIYIITYNIGNLTRVNYMSTFEFMFESFTLISSSTNTNSNINGS